MAPDTSSGSIEGLLVPLVVARYLRARLVSSGRLRIVTAAILEPPASGYYPWRVDSMAWISCSLQRDSLFAPDLKFAMLVLFRQCGEFSTCYFADMVKDSRTALFDCLGAVDDPSGG